MNADALRVMYQLDPNLSPQEIRDILWLATVLETRASGQSPESGDDASEPLPSTPNGLPDIVSPDNSVPSGRSESTIDTDHQRTADLYQSGADGSFSTAGRGQATLRTPAAVALPAAQGIARAMRPLMRRIPSRVQVIQDTDATVRRIADTGIWVPVLRPARARWFDVALVIDESQPMLVWQDTIRELQRLLERHGAFRTVRIWRLRVDSDGALTIRMGRDPVPRPAHALLDSTHRQLIVIASNCLSAPWYDGQMPALIQAWSQINPVALIQLLPQTLWRRTALRTARLAQFHAPAPAIPNQHYQWRPLSPASDIDAHAAIRLPILTLEAESFRRWAYLATGAGTVWMGGVMLPVGPVSYDMRGAQGSLRSRLSHTAGVLAGYLACTAPLTLPLMRLVQQTMLPHSRQVHLAEVLMAGILHVIPGQSLLDPNRVVYAFIPGVDEELRDYVPLSKAAQVLDTLSTYITSELGRPADFESILAASTEDATFARTIGRPFASIAATVLERFGGELAVYAASLREQVVKEQQSRATPSQPGVRATFSNRPAALGHGRRCAVLIGCNHAPLAGLSALQSPETNLQQLATILCSDRCGFEVTLLLGADAQRPEIMQTLMNLAATLGTDDTLLVAWGGHGTMIRSMDSEDDLIMVTADYVSQSTNTGLSMQWLRKAILDLPIGHVLLILDFTYRGSEINIPPTLFHQNVLLRLRAKTRYIMSAVASKEQPINRDQERDLLGLITEALHGLPTLDGSLQIRDIWQYVEQHFHRQKQEPLFASWGIFHKLVLGVYPELATRSVGDIPLTTPEITADFEGNPYDRKRHLYSYKALLVGINQYHERPLRGRINEVMEMLDLLRKQGLYDEEMRVLLDGAADRSSIIDGLRWLTREEDGKKSIRVFFYSGHVVRELDEYKKDNEVYQNCLMPFDYDQAGSISEMSIDEIFSDSRSHYIVFISNEDGFRPSSVNSQCISIYGTPGNNSFEVGRNSEIISLFSYFCSNSNQKRHTYRDILNSLNSYLHEDKSTKFMSLFCPPEFLKLSFLDHPDLYLSPADQVRIEEANLTISEVEARDLRGY